MLLRLSSGSKIAISPFFFWESRDAGLLKIRAASAFHPSHVTTKLCLELLERDLQSFPCRSVLDVGCGSGILALAAARRGVPFVVGLDTDRRAVEISEANAHENHLSESTHWLIGTSTAIRSSFDCILANLPYAILLEVLDDLVRLLNSRGRLILSGFQDIHQYLVAETMAFRNLQVLGTLSGDMTFYGIPPSGSFTWMAVHCGRRNEKSRGSAE